MRLQRVEDAIATLSDIDTLTSLEDPLATARSGPPSPFRSPAAIGIGFAPTPIGVPSGEKLIACADGTATTVATMPSIAARDSRVASPDPVKALPGPDSHIARRRATRLYVTPGVG